MKLEKKQLSLENGLQKEWMITNGIGGFSSSTVIGANTRKYHGLLIAPLLPPGRRFLILSKLDESITIGKREYPFYTNVGQSYISEGYKYQTEFEKDYIPIFTYQIKDVTIKKLICMQYGKNTVTILYKIQNGKEKATLKLAPIINFRDFHTMNTNHDFQLKQEINDTKVKVIIDGNSQTPIYMKVSEGNYQEHAKDTFYHMYYIEEEKRGFYPEENHAVTGVFQIELDPEQEKEVSFVCSLEENIEELSVRDIINDEIVRVNELIYDSGLSEEKLNMDQNNEEREFIKNLIIAADNFVVYRPAFKLHTIIAGYPWFLDWGRDTLIAFEGLLLVTKRYEIAKEVLLTMVRDEKYGLIPNGYSGFDSRPLYNSVDSSLLLFEAVQKYLEYTSDFTFIKEKIYPTLKKIIQAYEKGINVDDNNIYLDEDFLISSGTNHTQNTWMDAKYAGMAVTPRNGKAVEINSMWYNALKIAEELTLLYDHKEKAEEYAMLAKKCKQSFQEKFYNKKRKCLYDVLGDTRIRPNQLFSLSLTYKVLDASSDVAKEMFDTVTKKLLTEYGLRTLAKGELGYVDVYEGDGGKRDMSYHQGITWPWLLGIYYNAFKTIVEAEKNKTNKKELQEKLEIFRQKTKKIVKKALYEDGMIGSIAELYDSKKPQLPKGALAQAWSVAELLRIVL